MQVERRFNIAPGQDALAVTADRDGTPRADRLRWGLVPHWADDPKIASRMINARSETAAERPAFRDALRNRRCLIPADGFFEWQRVDAKLKQPWWFTREDHALFAFAGLWASWRPQDQPGVEPLRTFTILTTTAAAGVGDIHDRMPVMLEPEAEATWLDHGTAADELAQLLTPCSAIARIPVSAAVNDPANDGPDLLLPVVPAAPSTPTLF